MSSDGGVDGSTEGDADVRSLLRAACDAAEASAEGEDWLIQRALAVSVMAFAAAREAGSELSPFGDTAVTVTEVAAAASAMMKAVQLEVFELGMWESMGAF